MSDPVDLTNLRSMTDGDIDMEKALFEEFYSSFESRITILHESLGKEAAETWRTNSHALKGISLNLGADHLGALCKQGQDGMHMNESEKSELLKKIEDEYALVKGFLQKVAA